MHVTEYKTKEQKAKFYNSPAWKNPKYGARERIKKRDNYECQECKRQGKLSIDTNEYSEKAKRKKIMLVVDHIKELEDYPELALDDDNLETLCVNCHNKKHGRIWKFVIKKNKWADDERW
ncbi:gp65 [Niallia circulans]|uniref:HNH endonuclease n=1 Tax=Niallia circulans TaxID=1397 RepID=UPI0009ECFFE3|nr:HNH endonuclease signature motif containing protein [Niallia circulans]MDR4318399.1 HNH endonuclease [Niallia circulans]MED3839281.1 HNH endonuclease signature motif containing protein [Niallia circulans]MED4242374.1 HNH endonuclease signature motif containing protein [Niallia circulans]MED4250476.1 HNH endonuclease signature motif containing protein [Niallia circulans]QKH59833.1 HNH endonuclease [Niallia circulans]